MSFIHHYNDMSDIIDESKTGQFVSMNVFGHDSFGYKQGELGPVNFWVKDRIDENLEHRPFKIGLVNPLVVKKSDYNFDDLFFATKCVGYAVEEGYDSIIIETSLTDIVVTIDFDDRSLNTYLMEAKRKPTANKPKAGSVKRPSKAPEVGIKIDVLLSNTGKLSPARVERAMKDIRKRPPKITGARDIQDQKYFRAEYNFKSKGAKQTQMGYADVSQNRMHCAELFCSCSDFFYRLYAPYVASGLSTWNIPSKYRTKQNRSVLKAPHNHHWTVKTNPQGKLFLCKHLWAFLAYYIQGSEGNVEMSDDEINDTINQYFGDMYTDLDGEGDDNSTQTDFEKAFGKLYFKQQGKELKPELRTRSKKQEPEVDDISKEQQFIDKEDTDE